MKSILALLSYLDIHKIERKHTHMRWVIAVMSVLLYVGACIHISRVITDNLYLGIDAAVELALPCAGKAMIGLFILDTLGYFTVINFMGMPTLFKLALLTRTVVVCILSSMIYLTL